jgi:hypothetical protein
MRSRPRACVLTVAAAEADRARPSHRIAIVTVRRPLVLPMPLRPYPLGEAKPGRYFPPPHVASAPHAILVPPQATGVASSLRGMPSSSGKSQQRGGCEPMAASSGLRLNPTPPPRGSPWPRAPLRSCKLGSPPPNRTLIGIHLRPTCSTTGSRAW